ncbi:hypothetical protein NSK_003184 [Nannochloropsis salina CCMP1776]|jgi:DNA polymerase epsilon subunit 1|uniref:DNA-directed DNA polymerase n=1 Tax=Nannochloropsis salina CCMP1776 TaxID=1027361 RepID=A0A4D9D2Q3_9STRA|nr:hypothetical protein NSK_003184 [Nannochloropsis salina CCMP1776]|eukprot:TFJ85676.1 hypothetical protein NSK_003184 [Nannochloropsis salina CCMP1776]
MSKKGDGGNIEANNSRGPTNGASSSTSRRPGRNYANASQAARLQKSQKASASRYRARQAGDEFDIRFGYSRFEEGSPRLGWLLDMNASTVPDEEGRERSGMDLYFLQQDGDTFKVTTFYEPYFYIGLRDDRYIAEVMQLLQRKFDQVGMTILACDKEDLDLPNHLSGKLHRFLRLSFFNVSELMDVRSVLLPLVERNKQRMAVGLAGDAREGGMEGLGPGSGARPPDDFFETLVDIREYDVPYVVRVAIDLDLRVGAWYTVTARGEHVALKWEKDIIEKAEPRVLAFDIECTKAPLKFPDANVDQIFMISYMVDGQGYLLINREVVGEDIQDFEYTPKPAYAGPFTVVNVPDEEAVLREFIRHVQELRPQIFVTYNGDYFDWPFMETRMEAHGIEMSTEIGVAESQGEYRGRAAVHLDAFHWVKRDSYLPQGAQGLKAVTKYKLGYDPVEVDPEDMVRFAHERATEMASYSVSDAVATYYLYTTYVHNFIFSLSTIIPMKAEDVLRKGSGTLCETLLMVEAFRGNIVCPNKQVEAPMRFHKGHLLESETYVGGHVECLETGVYRSDIDYKFRLVPSALQALIDNVDRDLRFAVEVEGHARVENVVNYAEVKAEIIERLAELRDTPLRDEPPLIYHLDVGAMYPNIILTNRLQPCSIVDQSDCAACDFNQEKNQCKRPMKWVWRGDHLPATRSDFEQVQVQLAYERTSTGEAYHALDRAEQTRKLRERLKLYSHKVYKKTKVTAQEEREDTVCMRENPFYVNTVRAFRDRRYEYKVLTKKWKSVKLKAEASDDALGRKAAEDKETVFDSLQLAHKCILNSFYGYVMRKGARWRSMEMAGIVTDTGARLITQARELMEQIGRPLELDTDGIWCILPVSFPENFTLLTAAGKKIPLSYPCVMLNADVHERYTNHQYQDLVDPATHRYATHSECSIFFEVDGPYRCMVLPSSTEEGKLLKKRYAVFNKDGSLAELKGFELKRRGELELIKAFQGQVFECFLKGSTLEECYNAVGDIANFWLDVLDSRGEELDDEEVVGLISENKTISKTLDQYGDQKGASLTTASRLADFLGPDMVKDKGLNCRLVIANRPHGAPVTERAIPTAIFSTEPGVRKHFLRKWLKDSAMSDFDIRSLIDWDYYKERLGKSIQKIITIPAAMQKVPNPVPRVLHPDWLDKKIRELTDGYRQLKISNLFAAEENAEGGVGTPGKHALMDIEDTMGGLSRGKGSALKPYTAVVRRVGRKLDEEGHDENDSTEANGKIGQDAAVEDKPRPIQEAKAVGESAGMPASRKHCPAIREDFQGWLAYRKAQWREGRMERRLEARGRRGAVGNRRPRHGEGVEPGTRGVTKRQNVASFLKGAALAVTQGCWQVIEIRESELPGEFVVWAMTGQKSMQRLHLKVHRTMYITSNMEDEVGFQKIKGRRVTRFLPHGYRSPYTYEVTMDERRFLSNENNLARWLSTAGVTGVYELQTPLWFRAIAKVGCLAQVSSRYQGGAGGGKSGSRAFRLEDLESLSTASMPYLHPSTAVFRNLYVYISQSARRAVVALFVLGGDNRDLELESADAANSVHSMQATAQVWLANPFSTAEARPPLKRFFARYAPPGMACTFSSTYVASLKSALAQLNAALTGYIQERHGPTVVLSQSVLDLSILRRSVPALNDLPVVSMPSNADDNRYPALSWQSYSTQRMIQRFLCMPGWLQDRLQAARYSHLPLGNLGLDPQRTMADVLLGRLLHGNRHVLWASEGTRPDLGGAEDDQNDAWADEASNPVIRVPGAYRKVCIELEIEGLAVLSMLSAAELEEMDGAQGLATSDVAQGNGGVAGPGMESAGAGGGDDRACASAFRLLRVLVETWMGEVERVGSLQADALATNFWRWMCDADSLFYDPALRRLCLMLINKYFHRLVAEMRRLGAQVIFANAQRIMIATNKEDMASAHEYASFVLRTVLSRRIFSRLQITPVRYWWQLFFFDEHNFGGLGYKDPEAAAAHRAALKAAAAAEAREAAERAAAIAAAEEAVALAAVEEAEARRKMRREGRGGGGKGRRGDRDGVEEDVEEEEEEEEDDDESEGEEWDGGGMLGKKRASVGGGADEQSKEESAALSQSDARRRRVVEEEEEEEGEEVVGSQSSTEGTGSALVQGRAKSRLEEVGEEISDDGAGSLRGEEEGEADVDEEDYDLQSHWDMLNYLPAALRHPFDYVVATMLADHLREERDRKEHRRERLSALGNRLLGTSQGQEAEAEEEVEMLQKEEENHERSMVRFLQKMVEGRLTRTLLRTVQDIDNEFRGPECFPATVGVHRQSTTPALEFVKVVCGLLKLDSAVEEQVVVLRRQLLAQLGAKEFSEQGLSEDYCRSFVVPDLICAFCSHCRDLDLCRDEQLLSEDPDQWWRCPHCANRYDVDRVEQLLITAVERQVTRYALQDLRCVNCRRVSTLSMSEVCKCSGRLVGDEKPSEFQDLMATLRRIALQYSLAGLKEAVDFALRIAPDTEIKHDLDDLQHQFQQQQSFVSN